MAGISEICLSAAATVRDAVQTIDRNRLGVALIVDEAGRLVGTVTDGDVRRGLLREKTLESPVVEVMSSSPITASADASPEALRQLMKVRGVRHVPIVDSSGRPVRLHEIQEFVYGYEESRVAVVMAGGEGRRLRPITDETPKPMVKVGEAPILEGVVRSIAEAGIPRVYVAVNYKAEVIEEYFGDGERFGVEILYLREEQPLGTAGPLSLIPEVPMGPVLVVNGDIVTTSDFSNLFDYHRRQRNVATVAAVEYRLQVPLGVLKLTDHHVLGIEEKPELRLLCNAGMYVLNPETLAFVPPERMFHMTDLLNELIRQGLPVGAYPVYERWASIERPEDLEKAITDSPDAVLDWKGGPA